jgi:hypothetical protein
MAHAATPKTQSSVLRTQSGKKEDGDESHDSVAVSGLSCRVKEGYRGTFVWLFYSRISCISTAVRYGLRHGLGIPPPTVVGLAGPGEDGAGDGAGDGDGAGSAQAPVLSSIKVTIAKTHFFITAPCPEPPPPI